MASRGHLHSESGHDPVVMDRMILGTNPVEVDSVVADTLGYKPRDIRHIAYSADAGLGTCDLKKIRIQSLNRPAEIKRFNPPTHYSKKFPCSISAGGARRTCMGNLIFALERLNEKGILSERLSFLIGQTARFPTLGKGVYYRCGSVRFKTRSPADRSHPTNALHRQQHLSGCRVCNHQKVRQILP